MLLQKIKDSRLVAVIIEGYYRSGKGTFVNDCEASGSPVFETGKVMRALAASEPLNPLFDPVRNGQPVESGLVLNVAKRWLVGLIKTGKTRDTIYFDSIPRLPSQLPFIDFLKERGYAIKVVWFTTPEDVCDARPPRDGRPEDTDPSLIANRRKFYRNGTLPVLDHFKKIGMSEACGDLLEIDNTHLTTTETRARIKEFLAGKKPHAAHAVEPRLARHRDADSVNYPYQIKCHPVPPRAYPPAGVILAS